MTQLTFVKSAKLPTNSNNNNLLQITMKQQLLHWLVNMQCTIRAIKQHYTRWSLN